MEEDNKEITIRDRRQVAYYFESLVFQMLNKKLNDEGKEKVKEEYRIGRYIFDGLLPNGIGDLEGPTVLEVKLFTDNKVPRSRVINFINKINVVNAECKESFKSVLLILGGNISRRLKNDINNYIQNEDNIVIRVYFQEDLFEYDKRFEGFIDLNSQMAKKAADFIVDNTLTVQNNDLYEKRKERVNQLRESFKRDELVLFLGAGVSIDTKIGSWDKLISQLFINLLNDKFNINPDHVDKLAKKVREINDESLLLQASFLKTDLGDEFNNKVRELLYKDLQGEESKLLTSISKLCSPKRNRIGIQAVVTYNFDDLLETNFKRNNIDFQTVYNELDYVTADKLGIYHVHGCLPRDEDEFQKITDSILVFSEDGYYSLYNDPYSWPNITQLNFLRENTVLMIGLSLTDPNLRRLLTINNRKNDKARHYAILKKDNIVNKEKEEFDEEILKKINAINTEIKERRYKELGINIIWVDDYDEIPGILDYIRK